MTSEIIASFKIVMKKETKHSTHHKQWLIVEQLQDTKFWHDFP